MGRKKKEKNPVISSMHLAAEAVEPTSTTSEDGGRDRDGLHVGHGGGASEHTHVGGERRLQSRLSLATLVTGRDGSFCWLLQAQLKHNYFIRKLG